VFDVTQNPFVYGEVVPAGAFADRVPLTVDVTVSGFSS
jgi:hypothetical protein